MPWALTRWGHVMATVGEIVKTSEHNRHAVYVYDFDPATDEVIVVKKDAARVWVEGLNDARFLHKTMPTWTVDNWANAAVNYESVGRLLSQVEHNDCVEFVAVKTHRPPVVQEVAEPVAEAVPELSDEAKVKAVYPKAYYAFSGSIWEEDSAAARQLSLQFARADLAWADAARRLNPTPEPVSNFPLGCGVEVVSGAVLNN